MKICHDKFIYIVRINIVLVMSMEILSHIGLPKLFLREFVKYCKQHYFVHFSAYFFADMMFELSYLDMSLRFYIRYYRLLVAMSLSCIARLT